MKMDARDYRILIQNLLNRAVDIEIAKDPKNVTRETIVKRLEELKELVREQFMMWRD